MRHCSPQALQIKLAKT